jgi:hypothetical protein
MDTDVDTIVEAVDDDADDADIDDAGARDGDSDEDPVFDSDSGASCIVWVSDSNNGSCGRGF